MVQENIGWIKFDNIIRTSAAQVKLKPVRQFLSEKNAAEPIEFEKDSNETFYFLTDLNEYTKKRCAIIKEKNRTEQKLDDFKL